MTGILMQCGHTAQGKNSQTGEPVCVSCVGIHPGARIIVQDKPDLTGRKARCSDCSHEQDSAFGLPFFKHQPGSNQDRMYCGCRGWD